eukprot:gene16586-biopygen16724
MMADRTNTLISDPLYRSDIRASSSKLSSERVCGVFPRWILNICARAATSGSGISIRRSKRRRIALSSCHGKFVAASTRTPESSLPTPCIWTKNSVFTRWADSLSFDPRAEQSESISSTKMIAGLFSRASRKRLRTSFSLSPTHFDMMSAEETEKKVVSDSVATAFAR